MGIRYSSDSAELMAKLGKATGEAQAAKEQADRAAAQAARYQQFQQEQSLREQQQKMQMKAQAEQQRRQLEMQQLDEERWLRQQEVQQQAQLAAEERDAVRGVELRTAAQDFEMQKIVLREQQDFQMAQYRDGLIKQKEIERELQKKEKFLQVKDQLDAQLAKTDITDEIYNKALNIASMEHLGFSQTAAFMGRNNSKDDINNMFLESMQSTPAANTPKPGLTGGKAKQLQNADPILKLPAGSSLSKEHMKTLIAQHGGGAAGLEKAKLYAKQHNLQ